MKKVEGIDIMAVAIRMVNRKYKSTVDLMLHMDEASQQTLECALEIRKWIDAHPKKAQAILNGEEMSDQLKYYYNKKRRKNAQTDNDDNIGGSNFVTEQSS